MSLRRFLALFYCLSKDSLLVYQEAMSRSDDSGEFLEEASFEDIKDW